MTSKSYLHTFPSEQEEKEGGEKPKKILLHVAHDGDYDDFIGGFKRLEEICKEGQHLKDLSELHRDKGTRALAEEISKIIQASCPQFSVIVNVVLVPRIIIDCNRREVKDAIRALFDREKHHILYRSLGATYLKVMMGIRKQVEQLQAGDYMLDLHSMGDYCAPFVDLQDGTIEETIRVWNQRYPDCLREFDIIDRYIQEGKEERIFGTKSWHQSLKTLLQEAGIQSKSSDPYPANDLIASTEWEITTQQKGVHYAAIDIPKRYLLDQGDDYNLITMTPNLRKIKEMATILVNSILHHEGKIQSGRSKNAKEQV